jgi:hypothetical protein
MIREISPESLLRDVSVPVVSSNGTTTGMLSQNGELVLDGQVVMVDHVLTITTDSLGSLDYGDLVTVDDKQYTVIHKPLPMADGVWCDVPLQPVK